MLFCNLFTKRPSYTPEQVRFLCQPLQLYLLLLIYLLNYDILRSVVVRFKSYVIITILHHLAWWRKQAAGCTVAVCTYNEVITNLLNWWQLLRRHHDIISDSAKEQTPPLAIRGIRFSHLNRARRRRSSVRRSNVSNVDLHLQACCGLSLWM